MTRLKTPVQYEPVLDGLNVQRPLSLDDTVRRTIEVPVCPVSVNGGRSGVGGRLLRCNRHGALLKNGTGNYDNCELIYYEFDSPVYLYTFNFSQKVKGVQATITDSNNFMMCLWMSMDETTVLSYIWPGEVKFLPFRGTQMKWYAMYGTHGYIHLNLWGLY